MLESHPSITLKNFNTLLISHFIQLRRSNQHGNPIGVWRLANRWLAEALIARHAPAAPARGEQLELAGMAPAGGSVS